MASGSIGSAIAVKPRMSLKSTVDRPALAAQADAPSCCAISAATLGAK